MVTLHYYTFNYLKRSFFRLVFYEQQATKETEKKINFEQNKYLTIEECRSQKKANITMHLTTTRWKS